MSPLLPATSVFEFTATCTPGVTRTNPTTQNLTVPVGQLVHFEIIIPVGHSGLTGIQLRVAGGQVYPLIRDQWFIGDGRIISQDADQSIDSGAWQATMFNGGIYAHAWQVKLSIIDTSQQAVIPPSPLMASPIVV